MKKFLLFSVLFALSTGLFAQAQRVVLFEEFSGENCAPCAAVNPDLKDFIDQYASEVILLKYQTNIPSAGPLYYQNSADVNRRKSYYSVNSAPWGLQDGQKWNVNQSNHPAYWIQTTSYVDNRLLVTSPFNLSVNHVISADADSFYTTVQIVGATNYTVSSAGKLKLRVAMIEDLSFISPPGTNGETDFHHVMRKMYASPGVSNPADGTTLADSWTTSSNQSFTFSGKFPTYIYDKTKVRFVAFIQDDNTTGSTAKQVQQAAISAAQSLQYDVKPVQVVGTFYTCNSSYSPTVALANNGTVTLTSAVLDVYVDTVLSTSYQWLGSIPVANTQNVVIPALAGISGGTHNIKVIASNPNGNADLNSGNDTASSSFAIGSSPATAPLTEGFESGSPSTWAVQTSGGNTTWSVANWGSSSTKSYKFDFFNNSEGTIGYLYLPRLNLVGYDQATIRFDRAHAQYQYSTGPSSDKMEIEVSTNCGGSWQTVWNKSGSALATTDTAQSSYTPSASHWRVDSSSLSATAANKPDVLIRFKGTSDYGNNAYIDNVNVYQFGNQVSGVEEVALQLSSLYPNPANEVLNAEIALDKAAEVSVEIFNQLGQRMIFSESEMNSGLNKISISTRQLPQGTYVVQLTINGSKAVKKFNIIR